MLSLTLSTSLNGLDEWKLAILSAIIKTLCLNDKALRFLLNISGQSKSVSWLCLTHLFKPVYKAVRILSFSLINLCLWETIIKLSDVGSETVNLLAQQVLIIGNFDTFEASRSSLSAVYPLTVLSLLARMAICILFLFLLACCIIFLFGLLFWRAHRSKPVIFCLTYKADGSSWYCWFRV